MTNRQSNIIFYAILSLILSALIINALNPELIQQVTDSDEELAINDAIKAGDHQRALANYQTLIKKTQQHNNNSIELAKLYDSAALISQQQLKDFTLANDYYLQSLAIKQNLPKVDIYSLANTYFQLGVLAQNQQQLEQAQEYYEKALTTRLGTIIDLKDEELGMFDGMQQSRLQYQRKHNEGTIANYLKLAETHQLMQQQAIADDYFNKALETSIEVFGAQDERTLALKNSGL